MYAFGMGGMFLVWWCVVLGVTIVLLKAVWRFVQAHERIASALESIAAKK